MSRPKKGLVFATFWSKKLGIDFIYFRLESCTVLEGTMGVYKSIFRFNSK